MWWGFWNKTDPSYRLIGLKGRSFNCKDALLLFFSFIIE